MEALVILGIIGTIIGIGAGVVQVVDFFQKDYSHKMNGSLPKNLPKKKIIKHNLPPRSFFTGRQQELEQVSNALSSRAFIISIIGIGGIGKTSLALESAYKIIGEKKFEYLIWVNGRDHNLDIVSLCDEIAKTVSKNSILQMDIEERKRVVENLLREEPHLLIFDNFESVHDEEIFTFIENLPEPSKVLITSRENKFKEAHLVFLNGLSTKESIELIHSTGRKFQMPEIHQLDSEVLLELAKATGGSPLGIKWALGQIRHKGETLDGIISFLNEAKGDLFENLFLKSWELLTPNSRELIKVISLFEISAPRKYLEGKFLNQSFNLENSLEQLIRLSLVDANGNISIESTKYKIHPLTKSYIHSKINPNEKIKGFEGIINHYKSFVSENLEISADNFEKIEIEFDNILSFIDWSITENKFAGIELLYSLRWYFWEKGYWQIRNKYFSNAYKQTIKSGNKLGIRLICGMILVYFRQNNLDECEYWLTIIKKYNFSELLEEERSEILSLEGLIAKHNLDFDLAEQKLNESLNLLPEKDELVIERLRLYTYLGELFREKRQLDKAKYWFLKTLEAAKIYDISSAICWSYHNLGEIELMNNKFSQAERLLILSLEIANNVGRSHTKGSCYLSLGELFEKKNNKKQAKNYYEKALLIFNSLKINNQNSRLLEKYSQLFNED